MLLLRLHRIGGMVEGWCWGQHGIDSCGRSHPHLTTSSSSSWLPLCFQLTFLPSPSCISLPSVSLHRAGELAYVSNHFLPAPRRPSHPLLPPRFPQFPCLFPSCSRVPSQFDWSPDWCSYQSPELSLVRDKWTQRRSSPLSTSPFYLPQPPSFNKFVPVNKPSKMTPSP